MHRNNSKFDYNTPERKKIHETIYKQILNVKSVDKPKIIAVIGPTAAGKSTLMKKLNLDNFVLIDRDMLLEKYIPETAAIMNSYFDKKSNEFIQTWRRIRIQHDDESVYLKNQLFEKAIQNKYNIIIQSVRNRTVNQLLDKINMIIYIVYCSNAKRLERIHSRNQFGRTSIFCSFDYSQYLSILDLNCPIVLFDTEDNVEYKDKNKIKLMLIQNKDKYNFPRVCCDNDTLTLYELKFDDIKNDLDSDLEKVKKKIIEFHPKLDISDNQLLLYYVFCNPNLKVVFTHEKITSLSSISVTNIAGKIDVILKSLMLTRSSIIPETFGIEKCYISLVHKKEKIDCLYETKKHFETIIMASLILNTNSLEIIYHTDLNLLLNTCSYFREYLNILMNYMNENPKARIETRMYGGIPSMMLDMTSHDRSTITYHYINNPINLNFRGLDRDINEEFLASIYKLTYEETLLNEKYYGYFFGIKVPSIDHFMKQKYLLGYPKHISEIIYFNKKFNTKYDVPLDKIYLISHETGQKKIYFPHTIFVDIYKDLGYLNSKISVFKIPKNEFLKKINSQLSRKELEKVNEIQNINNKLGNSFINFVKSRNKFQKINEYENYYSIYFIENDIINYNNYFEHEQKNNLQYFHKIYDQLTNKYKPKKGPIVAVIGNYHKDTFKVFNDLKQNNILIIDFDEIQEQHPVYKKYMEQKNQEYIWSMYESIYLEICYTQFYCIKEAIKNNFSVLINIYSLYLLNMIKQLQTNIKYNCVYNNLKEVMLNNLNDHRYYVLMDYDSKLLDVNFEAYGKPLNKSIIEFNPVELKHNYKIDYLKTKFPDIKHFNKLDKKEEIMYEIILNTAYRGYILTKPIESKEYKKYIIYQTIFEDFIDKLLFCINPEEFKGYGLDKIYIVFTKVEVSNLRDLSILKLDHFKTVILAKTILNENSLELLKYNLFDLYSKKTSHTLMLGYLAEKVYENSLNPSIIIRHGFASFCHGIRLFTDLDYNYYDIDFDLKIPCDSVNIKGDESDKRLLESEAMSYYYNTEFKELIFNPKYIAYFMGIKILALPQHMHVRYIQGKSNNIADILWTNQKLNMRFPTPPILKEKQYRINKDNYKILIGYPASLLYISYIDLIQSGINSHNTIRNKFIKISNLDYETNLKLFYKIKDEYTNLDYIESIKDFIKLSDVYKKFKNSFASINNETFNEFINFQYGGSYVLRGGKIDYYIDNVSYSLEYEGDKQIQYIYNLESSNSEYINRDLSKWLNEDNDTFVDICIRKFQLFKPYSNTVRLLFFKIVELFEKITLELTNKYDPEYKNRCELIEEDTSSKILYNFGKDEKLNMVLPDDLRDLITDDDKWSYKGFCPFVPEERLKYLLKFPIYLILDIINNKWSKKVKTSCLKWNFNLQIDKPNNSKNNFKINQKSDNAKLAKLVLERIKKHKPDLIKWENYYLKHSYIIANLIDKLQFKELIESEN
jgi:hypothetical protein